MNSEARPFWLVGAVFEILGVFCTASAMYFLFARGVYEPTHTLQLAAVVCYVIGFVFLLLARKRMSR